MANQYSAAESVIELARLRASGQPPAREIRERAPPAAAPRKRQVMQPGLDEALGSLSKKTRFMKRARFNAQVRYEEKNTASILALAVVSVLAIAISMYSGAIPNGNGHQFAGWSLGLVANIMSLLALTFGFIVALGNYQDKSIRLQRCAMDLTRLLDDIENSKKLNTAVLDDLNTWTRRYHDIMAQCPYNHSDVDTEKAGFDRHTANSQKYWNTAWRLWSVWSIHALPFVVLAAFWYVAG